MRALALLALVLAALPLAAGQGAAPEIVGHGIHAYLVDAPERAPIGIDFHFKVRVENRGTNAVHVDVDTTVPEWLGERTEPADPVRIGPGATHEWRQTILATNFAPNGTVVLRVHALLVESLAASKHVDLTVFLEEPRGGRPVGERGVDPGPLPRVPRLLAVAEEPVTMVPLVGVARNEILVANAGTTPVTVEFRPPVGRLRPGVFVDVFPSSLAVRPGMTERVSVRVSAPPDAPVGLEEQIPVGIVLGNGSSTFVGVAVRYVDSPRDPDLLSIVVLGVPLTAVGVGVAILRRSERAKWWAFAAFAPLFTRLSKANVLDHGTRDRILALVKARPGIYWNEVQKATSLPTGVLVHHLRTLERHGFVVARRQGRRLRFFPVGGERVVLPADPEPTAAQGRVLSALEAGPLTQRELVERTGLTQQGVSYHLKNLERKGKIAGRIGEGERRYAVVRTLRPVRAADVPEAERAAEEG